MNKLLWFLAGVIMVFVIVGTASYVNGLSQRINQNGEIEMRVNYNFQEQGVSFSNLTSEFPSLKTLNSSSVSILVFDKRTVTPEEIRKAKLFLEELERQSVRDIVAKWGIGDSFCMRTSTRQVYCATVSNVVGGQPVLTWNLK